MTNLFWAFAAVWLLHIGYLVSVALRQSSLQREIQALKALVEQKDRASAGR
jgi:CcmD family protein